MFPLNALEVEAYWEFIYSSINVSPFASFSVLESFATILNVVQGGDLKACTATFWFIWHNHNKYMLT